MNNKPANELWSDYLFLTNEMAKLASRADFDMFSDLGEQRERLQKLIEQAGDSTFIKSEEGLRVTHEIRRQNHLITNKLRFLLNSAKQEQNLNQAYDPYSLVGQVGSRMDEHR